MPIFYPDILEHNNPDRALVDITQLRGSSYPVGILSETGSIPTDKRKLGAIVFVSSSQEFYGFYGQTTGSLDWDSTLNWRTLSTFSGSYTGSFSGSFIGNLTGTSSYANNALSSSFALTASFALNGGGGNINTGSFVTTSSFNAFTSSYNTGSFTGSFTGSLLGTASWAENSVSASYFSGSISNAISSSYALSSSFALTASYALNGGSGGGGNTQIYIDQSPDNGSYGLLTGAINGSNTSYTVSQGVYITGTLVVAINGQILTQGVSQDWVEVTPASGSFSFNAAPPSGSVITAWYNKTVVVGANFTSGTALPSGGNDGDIYLQYS